MKARITFLKRCLLLSMLLLTVGKVSADEATVTIGTETNTSYYCPYGNGYYYSTAESIYTPSEIGFPGVISQIAYYVSSASSHTATYEVYMGHKNTSLFSSTSDYLKDYTLVYSGSLTLGTKTGWEPLTLQTPFVYNGTDNLVIVICKKSSSRTTGLYYRYSNTSSTQTLRRGTTSSSGSSYAAYGDITSSSYSFSSYNYKPNIQITFSIKKFINEDDLSFVCHEDGTATLVDGKKAEGEVEIPETVEDEDGNEYEVTAISGNAFKGNSALEYVYIPSTITYIGANAFQNCTALTDIDMYSKATIGAGAFEGCTAINVVATKDAKTWVSNTFANATANPVYYSKTLRIGKNQTNITIPSSVTSISAYAFYNAQNLTRVAFEEGATSIGESAFYNCKGLEEIVMPGTITSIGNNAFYGDTELTQVRINEGDGEVSMGENVFYNVPIEDLYIGKSWSTTATINSTDAPFYQKTSIIQLGLGNKVSTIPTYAFYGCTGIKAINIPASATNIGTYAFYNCSAVNTLTFAEGSNDLSIDAYAFYGSNKVTTLTLPGNLTSLSYYNFANFTALTSVSFADGVKACELVPNSSGYHYAFNGCTAINSVYIGKNITWSSINYQYLPFYNKTSIKNVTYGGNATIAQNNFFYNCSGITSLTLGNNIRKIGSSTFRGCSNLTSVNLPADMTSIGNNAFYGCSNIGTLTMQGGSSSMTIGTYAFYNCSKIASLTIPGNVTSIGEYAFSSTGIKTITLEEGSSDLTVGTYIFNSAPLETVILDRNIVYASGLSTSSGNSYYYPFSYCSSIKSVTIGDHVTSIPLRLFYNTAGNTKLTIGNSLQTIGERAFYGNSKLTALSFPGTIANIGTYAFNGCSGVKEVRIGDNAGTVTIGTDAFSSISPTKVYLGKAFTCSTMNGTSAPFYGRTSITDLTIGRQVNAIPTYAFYGCTGLTKAVVPASVESIGDYAFSGCSNIRELTLEDGSNTLSMGAYVTNGLNYLQKVYLGRTYTYTGTNANGPFYGKTSINNLTIGDEVTNIPTYAFYGCSAIPAVEMPNSVTTLGTYSFYGCSGIKSLTLSESLSAIPQNCFNGCDGLTTLVLPANIGSIGTSAFANCSKLTSVTSHNPETYRISNTVFGAVDYDVCVLYVPEGTASDYADQDYWSNFNRIVEMLPAHFVVADAAGNKTNVMVRNDGTTVTLQDGVAQLQVEETLNINTFAYTRTYNNTNWQALYVPFGMKYSDWEENFDVARINNMNQYDDDEDGEVDRTVMEVFLVKSGSLQPNVPYLIRSKSTGTKTINMTNVSMVPTEEKNFNVSSWDTEFAFNGVYNQVSGTDMVDGGYYALGNGTLHPAASASSNLSAMRWYMTVTDRYGMPKNINEVKVMVFDGGDWWDEEETGILSIDNQEEDTTIYDINGRKMGTDRNALRHGMYIQNGKKFIVK